MSESRFERRERERREEARRAREYELELEREYERERKKAPSRKRRRSKAGRIVALILVLLVAFTGFRIWLETRPGAVEPIVIAGSDEFAGDSRVNMLFLGTNQGLSDTIMVFSVDQENQRLDEISIPRDTYYPRSSYPGAAYAKINSVYATEGPEGACRAAGEILGGIPVHYYAVLDSDGVMRIVDAMGGVEMNVPIDMDYEDPDQGLYIHLKAGPQLLSGDQAVQYLRFRSGYANADLGRVSAQQEFLKAVLSQSAGLDFPKVALTARGVTETNMGLVAQAAFLTKIGSVAGGTFHTHTIPGSTGMQDGLSYFFHDAAGTKELMRQMYQAQ